MDTKLDGKDLKHKASLPLTLLCGLGAALLTALSATKYGPGMTHDSAAYMYAAQSLLNGEGFQYFGYPSPFIQWPPLYSILLAVGNIAGLGFGTASTLINCLAFGLTVFFAGRWLHEKLGSGILAAGGTVLLLFSVPLLQVSKYMWTEMLFILFFFLFFIEFEKFLKSGRYVSLVLAAVFSALACVDRYAGVTIVAVAGLFLLFTKKSLFRRIADIAIFGVISILPMGIWVLRNYMVSGTLLGVRLPSTYSFGLNVRRTIESVYAWVQPEKLLTQHIDTVMLNALKAFTVLLPIISAVIFAAAIARSMADYTAARKLPAELKQESGKLIPAAFFTLFSAIYVVYLIASATSVAFEPINSRYLVPVYLPALLTLYIAIDYLYGNMRIIPNVKLIFKKISLGILLSLFLLYPALNTAASVANSYQSGAGGFAADAWQKKNGFIQYMDVDGAGQYTYYSSNADAVYVLSGIRTYYPPKRSGPYMYGLEQFKEAILKDENPYIIWFESGVPATLYNLEDISEMFGLEEAGSFEYGKVYRILKEKY